MTWDESYLALFEKSVAAYRAGNRDWNHYFNNDELAFLKSIGCQRREFFDFVEDFCEEGTPSASTSLLIAGVRRDYFRVIQKGSLSTEPLVSRETIPTFGDELGGMPYLPRILAKAEGKLRGTLDPDIMYGCGGDRRFFDKNGHIHPADFLRAVWSAKGDKSKILAWLAQYSA